MSTAQLTLQRDYLGAHRRMIIGRSLAASMVGAVPVPVLDDWLLHVVLRGTYRRVAEARMVDVSDEAVKNLIYGFSRPPEWARMSLGALAYKIVARRWRRAVLVLVATSRARAAARHFTVATLFDHYCARLHVGLGLDAADALALREVIDRAIASTPGGFDIRAFRRAVVAALRASLKAPMELADLASGGRLRRLLSRGQVLAAEEVDQALDRQLTAQTSVLGRATTAVELPLSAEGHPYIEQLLGTFDRLWRERKDAPSPTSVPPPPTPAAT